MALGIVILTIINYNSDIGPPHLWKRPLPPGLIPNKDRLEEIPMRSWLLLSMIVVSLVATPVLAQVWNETGDAGDLPATAQSPVGSGPLITIRGDILPDGDADMLAKMLMRRSQRLLDLASR